MRLHGSQHGWYPLNFHKTRTAPRPSERTNPAWSWPRLSLFRLTTTVGRTSAHHVGYLIPFTYPHKDNRVIYCNSHFTSPPQKKTTRTLPTEFHLACWLLLAFWSPSSPVVCARFAAVFFVAVTTPLQKVDHFLGVYWKKTTPLVPRFFLSGKPLC